jgi:uncharacterized protein HemY
LLQAAIEQAGNDISLLRSVATEANGKNGNLHIKSIERLVKLSDNSETEMMLGEALRKAYYYSDEPSKAALQLRAESAMRKVIRLSAAPSAEMYFTLGDMLEDRNQLSDSYVQLKKALLLIRDSSRTGLNADILRSLTRAAFVFRSIVWRKVISGLIL